MSKSKRAESGRSMVEMLGVLALLVFLTLGGVWLYEGLQAGAVAKDLTTAVMEEVTITHHDLLARQDGRRRRTRVGPHGIQITAENGTAGNMNNYFWVELGEVSSTVCQKIVDKKDKLSTSAVRLVEIFSGHTKQVANCDLPSSLVFLFQKGTNGAGTPTFKPQVSHNDGEENEEECPTVMCPVGASSCANNVLTCGAGYQKVNCNSCNMTCEQCPANTVKETESSSCGDTCAECATGQKPNEDQTACECLDYGEQCDENTYADGNCNCTECLEHTHCEEGNICDDESTCTPDDAGGTQNCPEGKMADGNGHCVECLQNTDCESNEYCDTSTHTCKLACTDGKSSYDKDEDKCVCTYLGGSYNRGDTSTCYSCEDPGYLPYQSGDECVECLLNEHCKDDEICTDDEQCQNVCKGFEANECTTACNGEDHKPVYITKPGASLTGHRYCPDKEDNHVILTPVCNTGYWLNDDGECVTGCSSFNTNKGCRSCTPTADGGSVSNTAQNTSCGTNQVCDGNGSCVCKAGYTLSNGSCVQCSAGYYKNTIGNGACTKCPAGKYSAAGATSCTNCPAGKYSAAGASSCTNCPAGKYSSSAGSSSCTNCPAGKYSAAGASSCTNCPAGKYSSSAGSSSCTNCPAGKTSSAGATSCYPDSNHCLDGSTLRTLSDYSGIKRNSNGSCGCNSFSARVKASKVYSKSNGDGPHKNSATVKFKKSFCKRSVKFKGSVDDCMESSPTKSNCWCKAGSLTKSLGSINAGTTSYSVPYTNYCHAKDGATALVDGTLYFE